MQRREFAMWLGAVSVGAAFDAFAQRSPVPVIGVVGMGARGQYLDDAFSQGLKEGGVVPGRDVVIDYRFPKSGDYDELTAVITDLVKRNVAVIVAAGTPVAVAAKSVTSTVPIVYGGGGDPVKLGLVASLNRPGGNVTAVLNMGSSLEGKRIQIIHDLLPKARRIAYLSNPKFPAASSLVKEAQAAASGRAMSLTVMDATNDTEIEAAFAAMAQSRLEALLVSPDSFFITRHKKIADLAAHYKMPGCYTNRDFTLAGGLISYGADPRDNRRQLGLQTARVLKGAMPADLPVIQSLRVELVLNRKTADKLRLKVSRDFLERVDELVE
jgi:putative ABC transport system substrate-binding protein